MYRFFFRYIQDHPLMLILGMMTACQTEPMSSQAISLIPSQAQESQHPSISSSSKEEIFLEQNKQAVIYGEDNRRDLYEVSDEDPFKRLALKSIAALVHKRNIVYDNPSDIRFTGSNFGRSYRLCDDEPFRNQPMISICSGTLIEDDLLVTAGHCVEDQSSCNGLAFVFGYYMDDPIDRAIIPQENLFYCQRLEKQFLNLNVDYAFIKLDRPVDRSKFEPAPLPPDLLHPTPLQIGDEVTLIGFPSGIPMKYAPGGKITATRDVPNNYFKATVDSYGGNSGSGVFNALGQQIGILVRGEEDFAWDRFLGCNRSNELDENRTEAQRAEEITRLQRAIEELCASGYQSENLCAGYAQSWCHLCDSDADCLDGWRCQAQSGFPQSSKFCASPCDQNLRCRMDHECIDGFCEPQIIQQGCFIDEGGQGMVAKVNRCGQLLEALLPCESNQFCQQGTCQASQQGDRCDTAIDLPTVTQSFNVNMQEGFDNNFELSCLNQVSQNLSKAKGGDMVYRFELNEPNRLIATVTGFNTILSLRSDCEQAESELNCNDDFSSELQAKLTKPLEAGTYYLMIDNVEGNGEFRVDIDFCDQICHLGDLKCEGQGIYECQHDESGCLNWRLKTPCTEREICENLSCIIAEEGELCINPFRLSAVDQSISQVIANGFHQEQEANSCNLLYSSQLIDLFYGFSIYHPQSLQLTYQGNIGSISILKDCAQELVASSNAQKACLAIEDQLSVELSPGEYQLKINAEPGNDYQLQLSFTDGCENPCQLGEAQCTADQRAVEGCLLDERQCLSWQTLISCQEGESCIRGRCEKNCLQGIETCEDMSIEMNMDADQGLDFSQVIDDLSLNVEDQAIPLLTLDQSINQQEEGFVIQPRRQGCDQKNQFPHLILSLILIFSLALIGMQKKS